MAKMADRLFVDTNVLLPFTFPSLEHHEECVTYLRNMRNDNVELWISGQVIREFYAKASNKSKKWRLFDPPLEKEKIVQRMETFPARFSIADESEEVRNLLPELLLKYDVSGLFTHDTNILATMLVYEIGIVCTFDSGFNQFRDKVFVVDRIGLLKKSG